ncbi:MAG: hypothetical protein WCA20_16475 [Candidatus Sulfotelmatobacter sp.]
MKLGTENRKEMITAAVLGVLLLLIVAYEFMPSSSTIASTAPATTETGPLALPANAARPAARHGSKSAPAKKERPAQSLDPTLQLQLLAATEAIKYEGSGRNIFVSQAEVVIPKPLAPGTPDKKDEKMFQVPAVPPPPPIPLKFFGFASRPGEPKKVFLIKGDDTFIAGEGEIVDRRYKVVKISPTSVDIQDVVGSGPPQSVPLTQGNPS